MLISIKISRFIQSFPYTTLKISLIESHDGMLFYDEDIPDAKGLKFLRKGLFLGECKKNRFEPSQALSMSLKKDEYKNILDMPADDERVVRYLKGETIIADEKDGACDGTYHRAGTKNQSPSRSTASSVSTAFPDGPWARHAARTRYRHGCAWRGS